jgi:hypothetical protein
LGQMLQCSGMPMLAAAECWAMAVGAGEARRVVPGDAD